MKKVFFMAAVIAAATVNVLMMSNDKSDLSALQMENIEALAGGENGNNNGQPDLADCDVPSNSTCWALHPSDPSKDKEKQGYRWR